jgi:hypothetical protein
MHSWVLGRQQEIAQIDLKSTVNLMIYNPFIVRQASLTKLPLLTEEAPVVMMKSELL